MRLPRPRLTFGTSVFVVAAGLSLVLAGPKLAEGYRSAELGMPGLPVRGVARVVDGDTFWVGEKKIRLWGMDAPEIDTRAGQLAAQYLTAVVARHELLCFDTAKRSYERIVARCVDPWERDISEIMVGQGWALDAPGFSNGAYADEEAAARAARKGLFALESSKPVRAAGDYVVPAITPFVGER